MKYLFYHKELNIWQSRWIEFLKDYEFGLNYLPSKANVVVDALSKKSLHVSWIMVEVELIESFKDFHLGVSLNPHSLRLNHVEVTSDFKGQIT